jgi:hypothetical protein
MKTWRTRLALAGLMALATSGATAAVSVKFSNLDDYGSMPFALQDREHIYKELTEYFEQLGTKLPAGTDWNVEVLDLDMAGRIHPNFRGGEDIRILRGGADWPRMHVRYSLTRGGAVIAEGDDQVSDMSYLQHARRANFGNQTLPYEKQMIDDWFKAKILDGKLAAR